MSTECLIPVARIKDKFSETRYIVTLSGDGLSLLQYPAAAMLEQAGKRLPISIQRATIRKNRHAEIQILQPEQSIEKGARILVERALLGDALLFADITGLPVYSQGKIVGSVAGYFETQAQGVLVVAATDGQEVLVPLVENWARILHDSIHVQEFESLRS